MRKSDPLVSVVTPVYNGEQHIRQCIESVLAQTFTDWDYTVVNNCSTDRTFDIACEYAAKDPRIRVVTNNAFVRVIANHNVAFRQIAPGCRYCKVVAADDWLFPECLEKMVALAERHPSVVIVGAYVLQDKKVIYDDVIPVESTVVSGRDACRWRLLGGKYIFGAATAVLFRADVVRSRPSFYNESSIHGDSAVNFELLKDHDFGFVHQVLTFLRQREGSMSSFSLRHNTYISARLFELVTYGPIYLGETEYNHRLGENLRTYYRYLATQVYERRTEEFWNFHRTKLAEVGLPLSRSRLAAQVVLYTLNLLLNPKTTIERLGRRLRRTYFTVLAA
jgi:glycosyltransferase involved in cell wall biosynthesis